MATDDYPCSTQAFTCKFPHALLMEIEKEIGTMAGDNQHDIPRFLLKGFASNRDEEEVYTWYFKKSSAPSPESTRNIGHSYRFYGSSDPGSLDARITKKENRYAIIVDRVREEKKIRPSDKDKDTLVKFVYFQGARTQAARETYREILVSSMKNLRQEYGNPEGMAQFTRKTIQQEQNNILRAVREELKKRGRRLSYREEQILLHRRVNEVVKEAPVRALAVDMALSAHLKESDKLVKEAHNTALGNWLKEAGSGLNHYRQLQWRVWTPAEGPLILGDAVVLYREVGSSQLSAGILGQASLVLLPLSHDLLLIGAADGTASLPSLDEINRSSAELSLSFFVSRYCSQRESEYHKLIGKRAPTVEQE